MVNIVGDESYALQLILMGSNERIKQLHAHSTSFASWQATMVIDLVKSTSGMWPTGKTDANGHPVFRVPSVDEVVGRALSTVEMVVDALEKRKWTLQNVSASDMVEHGAPVGFTQRNEDFTQE